MTDRGLNDIIFNSKERIENIKGKLTGSEPVART
jgi:hypothetical protein